jgi:hypothetical protein
MVLTEDDYLKFLVNAAAAIGGPTDPVPKLVRQAMSDSSLLLLGYELDSWEMRALFWGLIEPRAQKLAGAISIQVEPSEQEKRYLQRYYTDERKFDVFVGEVQAALAGIFRAAGVSCEGRVARGDCIRTPNVSEGARGDCIRTPNVSEGARGDCI